MKINKLMMAFGVASVMAASFAHAADATKGVEKKITVSAQINDGIFVSKPDGASWYDTEELLATDYKLSHFAKSLPVRVWTKNTSFNVSMTQPLNIVRSDAKFQMSNVKVALADVTGTGSELTVGTAKNIVQKTKTADGYDDIYNLTINADAPKATDGDTNGNYSGDLVMLFEPAADSDDGGETGL